MGLARGRRGVGGVGVRGRAWGWGRARWWEDAGREWGPGGRVRRPAFAPSPPAPPLCQPFPLDTSARLAPAPPLVNFPPSPLCPPRCARVGRVLPRASPPPPSRRLFTPCHRRHARSYRLVPLARPLHTAHPTPRRRRSRPRQLKGGSGNCCPHFLAAGLFAAPDWLLIAVRSAIYGTWAHSPLVPCCPASPPVPFRLRPSHSTPASPSLVLSQHRHPPLITAQAPAGGPTGADSWTVIPRFLFTLLAAWPSCVTVCLCSSREPFCLS